MLNALALILSVAGFVLASATFAQSQNTGRAPVPFTLSSPTLKDGGEMPMTYVAVASTTSRCGGKEISPPLNWSNAPPATKSFAMIMFDIDGRKGLGVDHWIAYDMNGTKTSLAEGEGNASSSSFVGGLNNHKQPVYLGPCPSVGDPPHHYLISIYALDLAPGALPAGLSRADLMKTMNGHVLALTSMVVRYGR